ncbi:leukocyte receptor cluster member 9-like [Babylonia areolata]|uniref:leukocyte receptor cluster member 9-like n=1 Tax=Babylonia areolata TaxID=304850 RepID=UPI003FD533A8
MASASPSADSPQTVEVAEVKAAFPGRCRVIKDIGMFSHVVTIQPKDMDVTLKFQLTEPYPSSPPEVAVRSESLTEEKTEELKAALKTQAQSLLGRRMLQALVSTAEGWLRDQGLRPGKTVNARAEVYLTGEKKKVKKQKKRKKKEEEEEEGETKKPSMKTAVDVIKRIMWDDKLDKDDFLVGYLDRFKGIQEKYFSAFSWEDIASVDYDVLAVPKHRIQYFKYREQTIWDKASRMDNVFGSTGSGVTVYDVISNYQEPLQQAVNGAAISSPQNVADAAAYEPAEEDSDSDSDDSDDDDDGITVTIGTSVNTPVFSGQGMDDADDEDEEAADGTHNRYWQDKMRPNHFLALRITDSEIRQSVEQIQDHLLDNEPLYGPCCIPPKALHITLCTLGLDTPEQVAHARDVLQRIQPELESSRPKEPLWLEGVGNFYSRVVYAKVKPHQGFTDFVDHVKLLVKEAGVEIRDNHDFVPHMTLMKVTRPVARQKGSKSVDPWLYDGFTDMDFGQQRVDSLHLCSMGDERREDGFYICPAEIHFQ